MVRVVNAASFNRRVLAFNAPIESGLLVDAFVKTLMLKGIKYAVLNSPEDTGYFKWNWLGSRNRPRTAPRGKYGPRYQSNTFIDRIPKGFIGYQRAWIVNNVEYASTIENGGPRIRAHRVLMKTHMYLTAQARLMTFATVVGK